MSSITYPVTGNSASRSSPQLGHKIGGALLRVVGWLVAMILCVPVLLLPFITSVPAPIWILLFVADIALFIVPFRLAPNTVAVVALFVGLLLVSISAVGASQALASTPPITDTNGNPLPNSIASLERVELGGSDQWITIRGKDMNNPVLLFLAGGPGGSELAWTRRSLTGLEDHFVIVNWDQPGCGKSYDAVPITSLTPERYLSDAYELVQLLRTRFQQDKIYLMGESGGTIWGIMLVQRYPELFHAFVSGGGQMVNTTENDIMGYEFALQYASERGDTNTVESLRRNGPPPYTGGNMLLGSYYPYLNVLNSYMYENAAGDGVERNGLMDVITAPEYGLLDKVNWFRGLIDVFTNVYPQLETLDFTTQAAQLEVPVYFIEGRWDVNAMASLVEEYYNALDAPHKELIWFENSGHTPLYEESGRFVDVMVNTVLAQTQPAP